MKYGTLLFDLDGTLTDPGEGITNSIAYALERFGTVTSDRTSLYKYIGPPLIDSFERFNGFSHADAVLALGFYREYFTDRGMFENRVYDGIPEVLGKLCKHGFRLFVATSKPEPYSVKILEHFGLAQYFEQVVGSTLNETRTRKDEVIEYAAAKYGIKSESALMTGDREHDILGAKKNGIDSAGVLCGYGSREELENAGADYIFDDVCMLGEFLMGRGN